MRIIIFCFFVFFISNIVYGNTTQNGKLIMSLPYETEGEKHWFVTTSGTGDCSSWETACSFRIAVDKTTNDYYDVIHLGAGKHDTNNGSDGTGTTISTNHVVILGMNGCWTRTSNLINSHATATNVLIITGDNFGIKGVVFDNAGQATEDVTFLNLRGDYAGLCNCMIVQTPAATSGTAVLIDNSAQFTIIDDFFIYNMQDYAIRTNGTSYLYMKNSKIIINNVGIMIDGATDNNIYFSDMVIFENTLGIDVDNSSATALTFDNFNFIKNTNNVTDDSGYGETHWENLSWEAIPNVYPAQTGTTISTGDGAWVWTAATTQIVPASTITEPFFITGINIQDHNAAQVFKIELFYGEAGADNSMGILEFRAGDPADKKAVNLSINMNVAIPANSYVGAKLMSSTVGVDNVVITLSYLEL